MQIRELGDADFEGLSILVLNICADSPNAMFFDKLPSKEELKALFIKKLDLMRRKNLVDLVAVSSDEIVGECEMVISESGEGKVGLIVEKGHRRKGIGTVLLGKSVELARLLSTKFFVAEVEEANAPAISFFLKMGFKERSSHNGRSIMVMEKEE